MRVVDIQPTAEELPPFDVGEEEHPSRAPAVPEVELTATVAGKGTADDAAINGCGIGIHYESVARSDFVARDKHILTSEGEYSMSDKDDAKELQDRQHDINKAEQDREHDLTKAEQDRSHEISKSEKDD